MCVILAGKIGRKLHESARQQNPHGFSLFTASMGLVKNPTKEQVAKAVTEFGIWHYRIATSGGVTDGNIHPFPVAKGKAYLYHNGIIGSGTATKSDTHCLADLLLESPITTVESVLQSLSDSNRFLLVDAKNPRNFRLFGKWCAEAGVLMSHKMYSGTSYSYSTKGSGGGKGVVPYAGSFYGYGSQYNWDEEEGKE